MPVSTTAIIAASPEVVWELISDFSGLKRWHPLVERCETEGEGVGARRTVYFSDWSAVEQLDVLADDRYLLEYSIVGSTRPQVIGARGAMSLAALPDGTTRLDWVSGLDDDDPNAESVNAGLRSYYDLRIGHLRAALGL